MTVERCECSAIAGPGSNDARYICAFRQARNFINDILPGLTVARYLQIAIIRSCPYDIFIQRRLRNGRDGGEILYSVMTRPSVLVRHAPHDLEFIAIDAGS